MEKKNGEQASKPILKVASIIKKMANTGSDER